MSKRRVRKLRHRDDFKYYTGPKSWPPPEAHLNAKWARLYSPTIAADLIIDGREHERRP